MKKARGIHAYNHAIRIIAMATGISIDNARHQVQYVEPSRKGESLSGNKHGNRHAHMSNVRRARKVANVKKRSIK